VLANREDLEGRKDFHWFRCDQGCNWDMCKPCYLSQIDLELYGKDLTESDFMDEPNHVDKDRWFSHGNNS